MLIVRKNLKMKIIMIIIIYHGRDSSEMKTWGETKT